MTAKHPRRYYNVTVSANCGESETSYTHLSKMNTVNVVKMALDTIENDMSASLSITINHESEKITRMLASVNTRHKRYEL